MRPNHRYCIERRADEKLPWRHLIRSQGRDGADGGGCPPDGTNSSLRSSHTTWGSQPPGNTWPTTWIWANTTRFRRGNKHSKSTPPLYCIGWPTGKVVSQEIGQKLVRTAGGPFRQANTGRTLFGLAVKIYTSDLLPCPCSCTP